MSSKKMVLKSSDGETFEVDRVVALESQTIALMVEDDCVNNNEVPLPSITSKILANVIEYCKKHVEFATSNSEAIDGASTDDDLKAWDTDFMKIDQPMLYELILAAKYLNIKNLIDLTCQTVADMVKDKSTEDIRTNFNIKNDFTPEEEEKLRRENQWAFK